MRSTSLFFFADTASALKTVRDFVTPAMHILTAVASLICVLFIVYAGYQYMMSRGKPDQLEHGARKRARQESNPWARACACSDDTGCCPDTSVWFTTGC